jgi:capsid assembly protease
MSDEATRQLRERPWAIDPGSHAALLALVEGGARPTAASIAAARRPPASQQRGAVAVLPLSGPMLYRGGLLAELLGLTTTETWGRVFQRLVDDPNVGSIVLDVDSPGGEVFGLEELAARVAAGARRKPVVAVANPWAASAAYWVASQASELVVTPSGEVGSIGVVAAHDDLSERARQLGVRRTYVTAGRRKAEGNAFEPLSEEARAHLQASVDRYYDAFTAAVARGRGVPVARVRSEAWGEGRMLGAEHAVRVGMADREGTLEETIARARVEGASRAVARSRAAKAADRRRLQLAIAKRRAPPTAAELREQALQRRLAAARRSDHVGAM